MSCERRYDIDWLRVIAIGLLLIYHLAIGFQPWGSLILFIKNQESSEIIWKPMMMLNYWRIPLLFYVSGMGVFFAMRKRNFKQLLMERSRRILIPYIFGIFCIVPLHLLLWQKYYMQDLSYAPSPGHLWFLGNIFIYVLVLSPILMYLKNHADCKFNQWIKKAFENPLGLVVTIIIPFVALIELLRPEMYELYALTWHGFGIGLLAFFYGFLIAMNGDTFWATSRKWKWIYLVGAFSLYINRLINIQYGIPHFLMAIETNLWVFTVLGIGSQYLNRPGRVLSYLSSAAYPIYIIHMFLLYLGSYLIFPLDLPIYIKMIGNTIFTFGGCFLIYEMLIRRIKFLRPLFGLKPAISPSKPNVFGVGAIAK